MQMNPAVKWPWSFLFLFTFAAWLVAGCATTKPIDWNSRIGTYTFDQAVADYGPPDKQTTLSDGDLVAQWITRRGGGSSVSVGTGFFSGPVGVGVGQTVGSPAPDHVLNLTFGADGKLVTWKKNY